MCIHSIKCDYAKHAKEYILGNKEGSVPIWRNLGRRFPSFSLHHTPDLPYHVSLTSASDSAEKTRDTHIIQW